MEFINFISTLIAKMIIKEFKKANLLNKHKAKEKII